MVSYNQQRTALLDTGQAMEDVPATRSLPMVPPAYSENRTRCAFRVLHQEPMDLRGHLQAPCMLVFNFTLTSNFLHVPSIENLTTDTATPSVRLFVAPGAGLLGQQGRRASVVGAQTWCIALTEWPH